MKRFIDEADRCQGTLLPESIDEYVAEENPVRVVDAFGSKLDLASLGFERVEAKATGWPGYHPVTMLKIYIYGYLNRGASRGAGPGNRENFQALMTAEQSAAQHR